MTAQGGGKAVADETSVAEQLKFAHSYFHGIVQVLHGNVLEHT